MRSQHQKWLMYGVLLALGMLALVLGVGSLFR